MLDRSGNGGLSTDKSPIFKEEKLFLKVLLNGNATLFSYQDQGLTRFFYKVDSSALDQLVYKKYLGSDNSIMENNMYKQQLWNSLKCENVSNFTVENLKYSKKELSQFFEGYNVCNGNVFVNYEQGQKKSLINLSLRPGLSLSSLSLDNSYSDNENAEFDGGLYFRYAIEAEFFLPFNNDSWSFLLEPSCLFYTSQKNTKFHNINVDYSSYELPIGIRYHLFLNDKSKFFINGSYVVVLGTGSTMTFEDGVILDLESGNKLEIFPGNNFALGLGYNKNNASLEMRYGHNRELFTNYSGVWNSTYSSISLIFGYTIYSNRKK